MSAPWLLSGAMLKGRPCKVLLLLLLSNKPESSMDTLQPSQVRHQEASAADAASARLFSRKASPKPLSEPNASSGSLRWWQQCQLCICRCCTVIKWHAFPPAASGMRCHLAKASLHLPHAGVPPRARRGMDLALNTVVVRTPRTAT